MLDDQPSTATSSEVTVPMALAQSPQPLTTSQKRLLYALLTKAKVDSEDPAVSRSHHEAVVFLGGVEVFATYRRLLGTLYPHRNHLANQLACQELVKPESQQRILTLLNAITPQDQHNDSTVSENFDWNHYLFAMHQLLELASAKPEQAREYKGIIKEILSWLLSPPPRGSSSPVSRPDIIGGFGHLYNDEMPLESTIELPAGPSGSSSGAALTSPTHPADVIDISLEFASANSSTRLKTSYPIKGGDVVLPPHAITGELTELVEEHIIRTITSGRYTCQPMPLVPSDGTQPSRIQVTLDSYDNRSDIGHARLKARISKLIYRMMLWADTPIDFMHVLAPAVTSKTVSCAILESLHYSPLSDSEDLSTRLFFLLDLCCEQHSSSPAAPVRWSLDTWYIPAWAGIRYLSAVLDQGIPKLMGPADVLRDLLPEAQPEPQVPVQDDDLEPAVEELQLETTTTGLGIQGLVFPASTVASQEDNHDVTVGQKIAELKELLDPFIEEYGFLGSVHYVSSWDAETEMGQFKENVFNMLDAIQALANSTPFTHHHTDTTPPPVLLIQSSPTTGTSASQAESGGNDLDSDGLPPTISTSSFAQNLEEQLQQDARASQVDSSPSTEEWDEIISISTGTQGSSASELTSSETSPTPSGPPAEPSQASQSDPYEQSRKRKPSGPMPPTPMMTNTSTGPPANRVKTAMSGSSDGSDDSDEDSE